MEESLTIAEADPLTAPPVPGVRDIRDFTPYREMRTPDGWLKLDKRLPVDDPNMIQIGTYVRADTEKTHSRLVALSTIDLFDASDPEAGAWFHLSVSRSKHLPSWDDLLSVRDAFVGKEELVIQVLAPASSWLNMFEHCLHLMVRIDRPTVPDALWRGQGDGTYYRRRALHR